MNIRERFFTQRLFSYWNRLPRAVVTAPSLTGLKEHIDKALWDSWGCPKGQELDFQLRIFCDSMGQKVVSVNSS